MLLNKLILPKGKKIARINDDLANKIFKNIEFNKKSQLENMFLSRSHIIGYVGTEYENHIYVSLALPFTFYFYEIFSKTIKNKEHLEFFEKNNLLSFEKDRFVKRTNKQIKNIPFLAKQYHIMKYIAYLKK